MAEAEKLAKVLAELGRLNDEYEQKFGFKFIVWVAGRPKGAECRQSAHRVTNVVDCRGNHSGN